MKNVERHFELDAGHRLAKHDFKCQNLHGHRYVFDVEIIGEVDEDTGLLMDFSHIKKPIMEAFDHNTILNEEDPLLDNTVDVGLSDDFDGEGHKMLKSILEQYQEKEIYLLDGEPSVENIADESAKLIFQEMSRDEKERIEEIVLEVYETPNCKVQSRYSIDEMASASEDGDHKTTFELEEGFSHEIDRVSYDD